MCDLLMVSKIDSDFIINIVEDTQQEINYRHFPDLISALKEIPVKGQSILILDYDEINEYSNKTMFISNGYNKNLNIIALTSDDSLENIRTIKERNIHEIIIKPIDKNRLNKIINSILSKKNNLANKTAFN